MKNPKLIVILTAWLVGSAILAYWIAHDRHFIHRKLSPMSTRPNGPVLEKTNLVYCPICGESIPKKEEDQ